MEHFFMKEDDIDRLKKGKPWEIQYTAAG